MAYVLETDTGAYGYVHGGTQAWPDLELALFPWDRQPFPPAPGVLEFEMVAGEQEQPPNIWRHNLLQDLVCDEKAETFFRTLLKDDLHLVARARCGPTPLAVFQVTTVLDVADRKRSVKMGHGMRGIEFPHVPAEKEPLVAGHLFRVRQRAPLRLVLAADDVVREIEKAGLVGLRFDRAHVVRD